MSVWPYIGSPSTGLLVYQIDTVWGPGHLARVGTQEHRAIVAVLFFHCLKLRREYCIQLMLHVDLHEKSYLNSWDVLMHVIMNMRQDFALRIASGPQILLLLVRLVVRIPSRV